MLFWIKQVKSRLGYMNAVEIGKKLWNETIATLIRVTPSDEKKHGKFLSNIAIRVW